MHLLLPFASAAGEAAAPTMAGLQLPGLQRLLSLLAPIDAATPVSDDDALYTLTPPHERALAEAWGWSNGDNALPDGLVPAAARLADADGVPGADVTGSGWALLTPTHWDVGADQVTLTDPALLDLDEPVSRALFEAVRPLFEDDGWALHWGAPLRWYAQHPSLASLPTASIDRVVGRNVDLWLDAHPEAARMRRLQAEVQMLLYTHPMTDERTARGALPVNSFWLSGTGATRSAAEAPDLSVDTRLRAPALAGDWAAWAAAWQALDSSLVADLLSRRLAGEPVALTLCGERHAVRYEPRARAWWQRGPLAPRGRPVADVLTAL